MNSKTEMFVAAALAALGLAVRAEPSLTSVTTHPNDNFFAVGTEAKAMLSARGLAAHERRPLTLTVLDFTRTNTVAKLTGEIVADATGGWTGEFALPSARYGVYYVRAEADGLSLPKVGTGPKGYFTYAVLEDPAKMPDLDPWDGFLGEHCADFDWLWQRGGLGSALSPSSNRLIVATTHRAAGEHVIRDFWTIRTNGSVQAEYRRKLQAHVRAAVAAGPGRQGRRIYENLWEPNLRAPDPESIVAAQKVAWEAIRPLDPDALVGAYTSSGIDLRFLRTLMEKGLGNYMNALTVHPYKGIPEPNGFVDDVRGMKRILREYMGRDIPMFATESGLNEPNTLEGEKRKLCGQLRQALILLGEGFQLFCPFYGCDYGADLNNQGDGDYGLNYNSQYPKVRFGCSVHQPRPIFGALAAFGRITEGHKATCAIEWLGETVLGYAFADRADRDSVIALWDWSGRGARVSLPVGRDEIEVADVMGNVTKVKTAGGDLSLSLSEYPQYVLHADSGLWGRAAQAKLRWSERRFKSANELAPVGVAEFTPTFARGEPAVAVTLANRTERTQSVMLETRVPGEPDCRRKVEATVPADGERRIVVAFAGFRPPPLKPYETVLRVVPEEGTVAEVRDTFNYLSVPGSFAFGDCRVKLDCDERRLKFDVTVADATPQNDQSGWWSWNGDSLQVALARECLRQRTQNDVADACSQALGEYTVAKTPLGDEVCRTVTWNPALYPCDNGRGGVVDAATAPRSVAHDGSGWHYVFALPWEFLNLRAPKAGTAFRLAMQYNDRVPDDRALRQTECFKMKLAAPKNFGWAVIGK